MTLSKKMINAQVMESNHIYSDAQFARRNGDAG